MWKTSAVIIRAWEKRQTQRDAAKSTRGSYGKKRPQRIKKKTKKPAEAGPRRSARALPAGFRDLGHYARTAA